MTKARVGCLLALCLVAASVAQFVVPNVRATEQLFPITLTVDSTTSEFVYTPQLDLGPRGTGPN